jgi:ADP-heptose:LPS heptosyltransferase
MNFPGLDPIWSGVHHGARALGLIRPWTIEQAHDQLAGNEKVLVVASTALGDSLLTTPLLSTLATHLGRERVSLLVKAPYADLYRDDPRLHRVFTVRGKFRWEGLRGELNADPHRIALLANFTEPDLVPELWHASARGFLRYRSRWTRYPRWMANASMLRRPGESDYASGHAIENNLALAEALGLPATSCVLDLPHFRTASAGRERVVLIHPGASRAIKRWPVDNWVRLAEALVRDFGVKIMLTGDRWEADLCGQIAQRLPSARNEAGRLSLPELARRQGRAAAFLSGDTGPYHLAVAVGCPTVTLFAPTDRGSSIEACGPHRADPALHRSLQTAQFGDPITTIPLERVLTEARDVVKTFLAREGAA